MAPGILPFIFAVTPHQDPLSVRARVIIVCVSVFIATLLFRDRRKIARSRDERLLSDILGYMTPVVALLLLFPAVPELGMTLLVILAFGDGSATLSGLLLGGRALPWNRNKTWSGLISFLCLSAPLAFLAFTATASPSWPLMHALQVSAAGAVAGAFAETFPLRGSDNTSVGVVGGLAILATHFAATHFAG